MSIESAKQTVKGFMQNVGKSVLSTQFPYDFEMYMCMLELADSQGNTIDTFTFPIMPDSIQKIEPKRTSIVNTAGGITVLTSPTYTPKEISIRGNFGRTFKILIGESDGASLVGSAFSISAGKRALYQMQGKSTSSLNMPSFDAGIKTGFGCIKTLQSIIDKSNGVDENGLPLKLFFYNMALGESYLVTIPPSGVTFSQNVAKNMIWEYSLNMVVVAPLESVLGNKSLTSIAKSCASSAIQKGVNDFASSLTGNIVV